MPYRARDDVTVDGRTYERGDLIPDEALDGQRDRRRQLKVDRAIEKVVTGETRTIFVMPGCPWKD